MNRSVIIHAGLLTGTLVAAYFVWTREPTGVAEDEIPIVNFRGELDKVIYASEDRTVEIEGKKDDKGTYHWVRVETLEAPPPPPSPPGVLPTGANKMPGSGEEAGKPASPGMPESLRDRSKMGRLPLPTKNAPVPGASLKQDPKADPEKIPAPKADPKKSAAAENKPAPTAQPQLGAIDTKGLANKPSLKPEPAKPVQKIRKVQEFTGNKSVDELIKSLSTLAAVRSLGKIEGDKLKAFGLSDSKKTLTLVSNSVPRVFIIGGNTYGNMDTYIQDKDDGRVYIIRPRLLQDFQYAEFRLMERNLQNFEQGELDRAVFTVNSTKKTLVQQNRKEAANAYWADENTPNKRSDFYRNWIAKLLRLSAVEYVPMNKKMEGISLQFSAEYFSNGKSLGTMNFYKQESPLPKVGTLPSESGNDYFVQSTTTRQFVKISRPLGEEISRDIPNLLKE